MVNNRLRGIVTYVSTGEGFKSPAVGMQKALEALGVEVECVDLFERVNEPKWHKFLSDGWLFYLRHPWTFVVTFRGLDTWIVHVLQRILAWLTRRSISRYFHEYQPDFLVSTHFISTAVISYALKKDPMPVAFFGYNSDVILSHQSYIAKSVHRYLIASEQGRQGMIQQGMRPEQVIRTSFPLDPKFHKQFDSVSEERERLGLRDMFTVLITFGGLGIGSYHLVEGIAAAKLPVQVVAICGRNEEVKHAVEEILKRHPDFPLQVRGFVTNMQDYLYSCDISAGKSGLNMLFESMYLRKPFLVLMAMANERFAARFLVDNGYGWWPKDDEETLEIIERVVKDVEFAQPVRTKLAEQPFEYNTDAVGRTIVEETFSFKKSCLADSKALFFDLAGTLCDIPIGDIWEDVNLRGIRKAFSALGLAETGTDAEFEGLCAAFVRRKAELRKEAKSSLREYEIQSQIREFLTSTGIETRNGDWGQAESLFVSTELEITVPFSGAREILSELGTGYDLYLLSNNASSELVWQILGKLGIRDCFKQVFVSADLGIRKPDKRFLDWVLRSTRVAPSSAVIIGDRLTQDVQMANEANMASVYCSMVDHDDNAGAEDIPYTTIVSSLDALLDIFPNRAKA